MRKLMLAACALVVAIVAVQPAGAAGFQDLESQIKEFTLDNGLKFVVMERHDAPVFSFRTYVDAGGVDESPGITGVAHMFEHMAFKGTTTIGSKDIEAELAAMAEVDAAWDAVAAEMDKGPQSDPERLAELETAYKAARDAAREHVVSNEFSKILEENGVVGMNASTFFDWTQYYYSLPSNRLELWARLEGDRLTNPVLREYYVERDVVYEERRMQESSPTGRLFQDWIGNSFSAHPYGVGGVIGHSSDLKRITRQDAQDFFDEYYVASNMTVAVVGDVKFAEFKKLAEKYFSGVRSGDNPPPVRTVEPRHEAEVRVVREEDAQPFYIAGFHIPGRRDPSWFHYELLGDIMGAGRSSRIYKRLVKEDELAVQAGAGAGFLGNKYPTLLIVQAMLAKDVGHEEMEAALYEELARLSEEGPTAEELQKVKTMNRAAFVRGLRSNGGLAGQLAQHDQLLGDWRTLFDTLDQIDAVTVEDVKTAAAEALRPGNRVVGILTKPAS